jgi:hypothetical protein
VTPVHKPRHWSRAAARITFAWVCLAAAVWLLAQPYGAAALAAVALGLIGLALLFAPGMAEMSKVSVVPDASGECAPVDPETSLHPGERSPTAPRVGDAPALEGL